MRKSAKKGQSLVEYVLLISLIAIVCIALLSSLGGTTTGGFWDKISTKLSEVSTNANAST